MSYIQRNIYAHVHTHPRTDVLSTELVCSGWHETTQKNGKRTELVIGMIMNLNPPLIITTFITSRIPVKNYGIIYVGTIYRNIYNYTKFLIAIII